MSQTLTFLFFTLAILTSCHMEKKADLITIDILEGLKTEKEFRLSNIADNVEYVKLETKPECLLDKRSAFLVGKKFIIAYQQQEPARILLFDRQGRFLRPVGHEGKGPLEYQDINIIAADPEETYLLVADNNDKLMKFDFNGNVVTQLSHQKSFQGRISEIAIKSSSEIFILLDYPVLAKKNFPLIRKTDRDLHQSDSLYPVTSNDLNGQGSYFWGHGSLFLHNGNIDFRPYSFDTLYEANKGSLVPRYFFLITKGHLSGPLIISSKQKREYCEVSVIHEFPNCVLLYISQTGNFYGYQIYDKKSGDLFKLATYSLPAPARNPQQQFINDIDGVVNPSSIFKNISNGLLFYSLEIIELKQRLEKDSLGFDQPKLPGKRKEFIELIQSSKEDDNPILQIFHLK